MPETIKPQKPRAPRTPAHQAAGAVAHVPKERKAHVAAPKAAVGKYIESVGRRKTAIARVRLSPGTGKMIVNGKEAKQYFPLPRLVADAISPLTKLKITGEWDVSAQVSGSGIHAQAGAVRLGVARALVKKDEEYKKLLRVYGFMTRDSRAVERKKYGKKKARRSPQWAKR
jgi:small subunit ribosomal protein S9